MGFALFCSSFFRLRRCRLWQFVPYAALGCSSNTSARQPLGVRHGHRASQSYHAHQRVRSASVPGKATGLFFRFGIVEHLPWRLWQRHPIQRRIIAIRIQSAIGICAPICDILVHITQETNRHVHFVPVVKQHQNIFVKFRQSVFALNPSCHCQCLRPSLRRSLGSS